MRAKRFLKSIGGAGSGGYDWSYILQYRDMK